jgi:hypothetical protein
VTQARCSLSFEASCVVLVAESTVCTDVTTRLRYKPDVSVSTAWEICVRNFVIRTQLKVSFMKICGTCKRECIPQKDGF